MNYSRVDFLDCPLKKPNAFQVLSSIISEVVNFLRWFFLKNIAKAICFPVCAHKFQWLIERLQIKKEKRLFEVTSDAVLA